MCNFYAVQKTMMCRRLFLRLLAVFAIYFAFAPAGAADQNIFSVGTEGFIDRYREPDIDVTTRTEYVSVTATDTYLTKKYFFAVDGRYSWGDSDYKSPASGVLKGEPEIETDLRARAGMRIVAWHGHVMPYIGLGWRYYFDQGKGLATNTGALSYDRHISQIYAPIGVTYPFTYKHWNYRPTFEFDPLIYGRVSSHLRAIGAEAFNPANEQHSGFGLRGEFMVGQHYKEKGFGWEAGPFVRYWRINGSNCVASVSSPGICWLEPENTRLQMGAAFRINF